jgi:PST family polysaccharide transporter
VRATLVGGSAAIIATALGLVQTKVFALFLGPEGVGVFGLLVQFTNFATLVSGLGLQNATIKYVSFFRSKNDTEAVTRTIVLIFGLTVAVAAGVALVIVVFSSRIAAWLIPGRHVQLLVAIFAATLPVMGARNVLLNVLLGYKAVQRNAVATVIPSIVGASCVYWLVTRMGINGAGLFYVVVTLSGLALSAYQVRQLFREQQLSDFRRALSTTRPADGAGE